MERWEGKSESERGVDREKDRDKKRKVESEREREMEREIERWQKKYPVDLNLKSEVKKADGTVLLPRSKVCSRHYILLCVANAY